jgi:hypothetical protein
VFPIDFPEILFFSWVSHSFPVVSAMANPHPGLHVGGGAQLFDLLHGHSQLPLQGLADGLGEGFAMEFHGLSRDFHWFSWQIDGKNHDKTMKTNGNP